MISPAAYQSPPPPPPPPQSSPYGASPTPATYAPTASLHPDGTGSQGTAWGSPSASEPTGPSRQTTPGKYYKRDNPGSSYMGGGKYFKRRDNPGSSYMSGKYFKRDMPGSSFMSGKYMRETPGSSYMSGKYFRKRQGPQPSSSGNGGMAPPPPAEADGGGPPTSFWTSLGSKASSWYKNAPSGAGAQGSAGSPGDTAAGSGGSGAPAWSGQGTSGGATPGGASSSSPQAWSGAPSAGGSPSSGAGWSGQGSTMVATPGATVDSQGASPTPWSQAPPPPPPSQASQGSNQRRRSRAAADVAAPTSTFPMQHGGIGLSGIPINGPATPPSISMLGLGNSENIPNLSFSLNPMAKDPSPPGEAKAKNIGPSSSGPSAAFSSLPLLSSPRVIGLLPPPSPTTFMSASPGRLALIRNKYQMITQPAFASPSLLGPSPSPSSDLLRFAAQPSSPPVEPLPLRSPPGAMSGLYVSQSSADSLGAPAFITADEEFERGTTTLLDPQAASPLAASGTMPLFARKPIFSSALVATSAPSPALMPSNDYFLTPSASASIVPASNTVNLYRIGRSKVPLPLPPLGGFGDKVRDSTSADPPIVIYKVSKDKFGAPKEVEKVILDPQNGLIIDHNSKGDLSIPKFPTEAKRRRRRRRKRSAEDSKEKEEEEEEEGPVEESEDDKEKEEEEEKDKNMDPNGHTHSDVPKAEGDQMMMGMGPFFKDMFMKRRRSATGAQGGSLVQYQTSGDSTDYDYDRVQVEDEDDEQIRASNKDQTGQPEEERRRRRVKIDFVQKTEHELPSGTVEKISAGGGKAPGHHEGGGLTVKVKDGGGGFVAAAAAKRRNVKQERKTLNFFFTW